MDPDELVVSGGYDKEISQVIFVDVVKCVNATEYDCKSDEEIEKYFSKKMFQILQNQVRFDSSKYGEESIILESRLDVIKMGSWR